MRPWYVASVAGSRTIESNLPRSRKAQPSKSHNPIGPVIAEKPLTLVKKIRSVVAEPNHQFPPGDAPCSGHTPPGRRRPRRLDRTLSACSWPPLLYRDPPPAEEALVLDASHHGPEPDIPGARPPRLSCSNSAQLWPSKSFKPRPYIPSCDTACTYS
jgi:hypothetical protein